jgi:Glycosyltransferase family 87
VSGGQRPAGFGDHSDEFDGTGSWRLGVLAACAFGLAVVLNAFIATILAAVGLVLLWFSIRIRVRVRGVVTDLRLTAAVVSVAVVAIVVPQTLNGSPSLWITAAVPATVILLVLADVAHGWTRRHLVAAGVVLAAAGLLSGVWIVHSSLGLGLDVVLLHEKAAAALAGGLSPYGDAVSTPNGAPGAPPGSMIVGYPYPPIAAFAYALSTWALHDPRWINLACWIVLLFCAVILARNRHDGLPVPVLLVAGLPGWSFMLQSGWTEPLSAAWIGLAAAAWERPVLGGLALGAAVGSKQYFIATLPLILLYRGEAWRRRGAAAAAGALLILFPAVISGAADAWRSLVLFHAQTPLRPDSSNVIGLLMRFGVQWAPPAWLATGVTFALVAFLARRISTSAEFWRTMAFGLAVFFMLSRQALPNYWYLVAVIAALGSLSEQRRPPFQQPA